MEEKFFSWKRGESVGDVALSERVKVEYERIKGIFEKGAPEQVELLEGVFLEAARIKAELDVMSDILEQVGCRIRYNPKDPKQQKVLPIAKELEKARASYVNYMFRLSRALGLNEDEEEDGLAEFE